jgi:hypothetical protein
MIINHRVSRREFRYLLNARDDFHIEKSELNHWTMILNLSFFQEEIQGRIILCDSPVGGKVPPDMQKLSQIKSRLGPSSL